jgi:prephenate dehydrogenase/chorismate mutase
MENLKLLRQRLDEIDFQIVKLLNKRMELADEIAEWKTQHQTPITDLEREMEVMTHVHEEVKNPVLNDFIDNIYKQIIDCAKASQSLRKRHTLPFFDIGIIGLGLIGGSIAKSIKAKQPSIRLYALDFPDAHEAIQSRLIDKTFSTLCELADHCDLIVLATPISTIIPIAQQISEASNQLKRPLLVIDIASVKGKIVDCFETLTSSFVEYLSTHPMAGSEKSGFKNSVSSLFVNAPWVIVPHKKNHEHRIDQTRSFIEFLGAAPCLLNAQIHDKRAALISHLPGQISQNIFNFVKQIDPESLEMAGPGFKSMTRLAHSNPLLRSEIASANAANIKYYLNEWLKYIQKGENA